MIDRYSQTTLHVGGQAVALERAADRSAHQKGLSGRDSLAKDHGMLFVFARDQAGCFWMKDMRFPLDIIWLDFSKQVTQIVANAAPSTYPRTFCPEPPATYVIELNAGRAKELGIAPGQTLNF